MINKKEIIGTIFEFLYSGYLIPITFIILIIYFKSKNKLKQSEIKFLADFFVIAIFIFSIDITLFPHRYFNLIKDYIVIEQIYSKDLQFVMNTYENNISQELTKINVKDGILEEFRYIKDVKK